MDANPSHGPLGPEGTLHVASYNTHRAVGSDRRRNPERIASVLLDLKADVIGLQEVDWHHDIDEDESQFEYLSHLPGYRAIAGPNLRDHRGHYGNLLLTRLPISRVGRIDLSEPNREPRGAIDVDLAIGPGCLRIIATHLGLGLRERWRQASQLRETVAARPGTATLVLGDFNEWLPGNPTLRPLLTLGAATTRQATWPSSFPLLALDQIFAYSFPIVPEIRVFSSPVVRKASDHLPLVAEVQIGHILAEGCLVEGETPEKLGPLGAPQPR